MDGASGAESDHSLTWEDFYGSTTDLTPTLLGILNTFLEPPTKKPTDPVIPVQSDPLKQNKRDEVKRKMEPIVTSTPSKDPRLITGSIKLPGLSSEESSPVKPTQPTTPPVTNDKKATPPSKMSYVSRLKSFSLRKNGEQKTEDNDNKLDAKNTNKNAAAKQDSPVIQHTTPAESADMISKLNSEVIAKVESNRKHWSEKNGNNSFENLSPNVRKMISSAGAENCTKPLAIPQPKKPNLGVLGRSSYRSKHSIIPLMGTTSKLTQSSMDIETEIYDKPTNPVSSVTKINITSNGGTSIPRSNAKFIPPIHSNLINKVAKDWSSPKVLSTFSPDSSPTKLSPTENPNDYDTPTNSIAIYDIPNGNLKVFSVPSKTTSLIFIDQDETAKRVEDQNGTVTGLTPTIVTSVVEDIDSKQQVNGVTHHSKVSGSNDDLKTSNVQPIDDNKLGLPNMNTVIRPLSMSSIASSTSTSSSGNQNKGGANSAYLASIESLDDHSDTDTNVYPKGSSKLAQINGSSLTVDSTDGGGNDNGKSSEASQPLPMRAPTPPRPRYCDPSLSLLQRVCTEIVDTENVYVEDLRQVVEGYLYYWRENETFTPEQLSDLFSNIEEIYNFNRSFSQQLNECNLEAVAIAKRFVHHSTGFTIYTQYCTDYPGIMAALAHLLKDVDTAQSFRARQAALGHALPLGSYLLKPVQRILKYHLLLQNLVKQHKSTDTEYALHKMTDIAHDINDMKRRHEHSVRVQEIQSLLYGWNGQDLTTFGELCAEGTFRVFGAKAMRHVFLFDKMLLLTKNKEYGMLAYKSHIMCNNLMLVESIQGQPLSFHVIPFDNPRMQVTLQARSIQHKREWTLLIKRNILENYNAVIPSHARQLVMELGQNKTDDDILAEKSTTLISHASMRKQLGAPEYLEKRKLDRDRRKSFESGLRYRLKKPANRKGQVYDSSLENDESERENNVKDNTNDEMCHLHYVCSECHREKSNCNECDETYVCVNCIRTDEFNKNIKNNINSHKCTNCNTNLENETKKAIKLQLQESNKCKSGESHFVGCKCSKSCFLCSKLESSKEFSSNENINSQSNMCDKCVNLKVLNSHTNEKKKDMYDRLIDDKYNKIVDIKRTCLKCHGIRENIIVTNRTNYNSDLHDNELLSNECNLKKSMHNGSKDDSQVLTTVKTNTPRRKSEPGLTGSDINSQAFSENDKLLEIAERCGNNEKACVFCGNMIISCRNCGTLLLPRSEIANKNIDSIKCDCGINDQSKNSKTNTLKPSALEVKMYNAKTVPKKISKIKKNRAKTLRQLTMESTAKFYTDVLDDFSSDNVLHISESTESVSTSNNKCSEDDKNSHLMNSLKIPSDMDEEMYKNLIQKTDSFKKNEIEKEKLILQTKQNEVVEVHKDLSEDDVTFDERVHIDDDVFESCDDGQSEKPLEQIISQLLMQNREFQKILKKHQLKSANNRRHQRLLKSHSNPEKIFTQNRDNPNKVKPKFTRQMSAIETSLSDVLKQHNGDSITLDEEIKKIDSNITNNEHIYETLTMKCESTSDDDCKLDKYDMKSPHCNDRKLEFALKENELDVASKISRNSITESDYVYLCFDKKESKDLHETSVNDIVNFDDSEYAIPKCSLRKVHRIEINSKESEDLLNNYENTSDIWKRISKDTVIENKNFKNHNTCTNVENNYSDIDNCPQSPNIPKVWLNRQKEHFNTPREKKSGSLPRSFQVVLNDEQKVTNVYQSNKPGILNKVYLNKEGKVMQTDRPFTIASDHSEISYDDIERFIKVNDDTGLKFPQKSGIESSSCSLLNDENIDDIFDNDTRSTLEAEIDRCYKSKFNSEEQHLKNALNNEFRVTDSISSSMEVINDKLDCETSHEDIASRSMHPEHKIYKPTTSNALSFKGVLNRFKSKNHSNTEQVNAENSYSQKQQSTQKKTSPKHSKINFLQRLKSIKNDDRNEVHNSPPIEDKDDKNKKCSDIKNFDDSINSDIKIPQKLELMHSRSFCEETVSCDDIDSEMVSRSCINLPSADNKIKTSTLPQTNTNSAYKSSRSTQELDKLPIYKQGSRLLGARIAQSDYADPKLLRTLNSNTELNKANVFINKSSLRPDSVLSNSSHFTSSSDGCFSSNFDVGKYKSPSNDKCSEPLKENNEKTVYSTLKTNFQIRCDESFYEKSFEEIEKMFNNDEIFRDSAIYSDPDDSTSYSNEIDLKHTQPMRNVFKPISDSKNSDYTSRKIEPIANSKLVIGNEKIQVTQTNEIDQNECNTIKTFSGKMTFKKNEMENNFNSSKLAPPVPVKPMIAKIPTHSFKYQSYKNITTTKNTTEDNTDIKESASFIDEYNNNSNNQNSEENNNDNEKLNYDVNVILPKPVLKSTSEKPKVGIPRPNFQRSLSSSVNMKRMSFERSSFDSSIINRHSKNIPSPNQEYPGMVKTEELIITKSVQERRKEIEKKSENCTKELFTIQTMNKKSIEDTSMTFNRSYSMMTSNCVKSIQSNSEMIKYGLQKTNIPTNVSTEVKNTEAGKISKPTIKQFNISTNKNGALSNPPSPTTLNVENIKLTCETARGGWVKQVVNRFQ